MKRTFGLPLGELTKRKMSGCQVIKSNNRRCKNYARKGMTCCYAHRKLENDEPEPNKPIDFYTLECGHEIGLDVAIYIAIADASFGGDHCPTCNKRLSLRESAYLAFADIKAGETIEQYEESQKKYIVTKVTKVTNKIEEIDISDINFIDDLLTRDDLEDNTDLLFH